MNYIVFRSNTKHSHYWLDGSITIGLHKCMKIWLSAEPNTSESEYFGGVIQIFWVHLWRPCPMGACSKTYLVGLLIRSIFQRKIERLTLFAVAYPLILGEVVWGMERQCF